MTLSTTLILGLHHFGSLSTEPLASKLTHAQVKLMTRSGLPKSLLLRTHLGIPYTTA